MKTLSRVLLTLCTAVSALAQAPAYYHDTTLDGVNTGVSTANATLTQLDADTKANKPRDLTNEFMNVGGSIAVGNQNFYATNSNPYANTQGNSISNAFNGIVGGLTFTNDWTPVSAYSTITPVSASVITIPVSPYINGGVSLSMDFSINSLSTANKTLIWNIRIIIEGFIYLTLFCLSFTFLQKQISEAMNQKQLGGMNIQAFTFGTTGAVAVVYASITVALLTTVFGYIATNGFIKTAMTVSMSAFPIIHTLTNVPGYDIATLCFPLPEALGALITYLTFRYLFSFPLFLLVRSIQLFLLK